jgi:hypothetical protein
MSVLRPSRPIKNRPQAESLPYKTPRSSRPVLDAETGYARKLTQIVRDERQVKRESVGGDEQVAGADRRACTLQFGTDASVMIRDAVSNGCTGMSRESS